MDVPFGTFASGDFVKYDIATGTFIGASAGGGGGDVTGPASAVLTRICTFANINGKVIQDNTTITASGSTITASTFQGFATGLKDTAGPSFYPNGSMATVNGVLRVSSTPAVVNGPMTCDAAGAVGGVTTLTATLFNGPANALRDTTPATFPIGSLGVLSGIIRMSSIGTIVNGPATMDGVGNIAAAGTYNGVNVAAHAARHLPAGADTMFPGTYAAGDVAVWSGAAWVPKFRGRTSLAAALGAIAANTQVITGFSFSLPRAGTYDVSMDVIASISAQPRTVGAGIRASANFTSCRVSAYIESSNGAGVTNTATAAVAVTAVAGTQVLNGAANGTVLATCNLVCLSKIIVSNSQMNLFGQLIVSGACTLDFLCFNSATQITIQSGSCDVAER